MFFLYLKSLLLHKLLLTCYFSFKESFKIIIPDGQGLLYSLRIMKNDLQGERNKIRDIVPSVYKLNS